MHPPIALQMLEQSRRGKILSRNERRSYANLSRYPFDPSARTRGHVASGGHTRMASRSDTNCKLLWLPRSGARDCTNDPRHSRIHTRDRNSCGTLSTGTIWNVHLELKKIYIYINVPTILKIDNFVGIEFISKVKTFSCKWNRYFSFNAHVGSRLKI